METNAKRGSLLLAGAAATASVAWAAGAFEPAGLGPDPAAAADLRPFDSCEELLAYADDHRWAAGGYYPGGPIALEDTVAREGVAVDAMAAGAAETAAPVGPGETGTNVQEAGVDEPDLAKLQDETLFVLTRGKLEALDVSGASPEPLGRLELGGDRHVYGAEPQLLVAGDRAVVITAEATGPEWSPATRLLEIDISDPAALKLVRTSEIEGAFVSGRLTGDVVRLVLTSQVDFPRPAGEGEEPSEPQAGATGATGPVGPDPSNPGWLPQVTVTDAATGESATAALFGCDAVAYPREFAGLGLLSVLTLDVGATEAADTDVVMTNGETVYASPTGLYVATQSIPEPDPVGEIARAIGSDVVGSDVVVPPSFKARTLIHRFDTTEAEGTEYAASGEVEGRLLDQFSMSEHEGHLRVATTTGDAWAEGQGESESGISVLDIEGEGLETVGEVGGLGRGEEIYAVRFLGDAGYVVTFEQTDPLYAVDLSDPTAPETTGELKIPGYSAYLHPVGDGQLLGIGQAGTAAGLTTGAQASLFDVSDPADPTRAAKLDLAGGDWGQSAAESDHHAFLYWPGERLAVAPVASYGPGGFRGAVAMRVGADGTLAELGRLEDDGGEIRRMLVAGERLVTVTNSAVTLRALDGLETTGTAALGG
ncbi:MAG: beta-propeller domain-containing protein [Solirubrobacterales bacterium]